MKTREEAIKVIGRFLIYYRDNAKWLERTYDFAPRIGLEKLREIIVNDSLGIGDQLDAEVEKTAAAYVDPWLERDKPAFAGQIRSIRSLSAAVADEDTYSGTPARHRVNRAVAAATETRPPNPVLPMPAT